MTIAAEKEALRKEAQARRAHLKREAPEARLRMAEYFLNTIPVPADAVVSAYSAIGDEADPAPLIAALRLRGHPIALPRVVGRGQALALHLHAHDQELKKGGYGLSEPDADWPLAAPAVLIVPLLAFDAGGRRLGYGAGYYDRTLAFLRTRHPILAVGFAYAGQEVEAVPHHEGDETLDWVVTELYARKFSGRGQFDVPFDRKPVA
jgi:5-formyltetrahydrofolate cyclo-ligase